LPPPLENAKGLDSLQLPRFGLHKKNQNVTRQVLWVQNISQCIYDWGCAANPDGNLTMLPQIIQLHLSLFEGRRWYGGKWNVSLGLPHITAS